LLSFFAPIEGTTTMMKIILSAAMSLSLVGVADAAVTVAPVEKSNSGIIQVYGGCGPYGHRGPYGGCRAGGQWGGYRWGRACPPGFHLGPYGRRCWPN
jgi:hypothetical protein